MKKSVIIINLLILLIIFLPFYYTQDIKQQEIREIITNDASTTPCTSLFSEPFPTDSDPHLQLTSFESIIKGIKNVDENRVNVNIKFHENIELTSRDYWIQLNFVSKDLWEQFNTNDSTIVYSKNPSLINTEILTTITSILFEYDINVSLNHSSSLVSSLPLHFSYEAIYPSNTIELFFRPNLIINSFNTSFFSKRLYLTTFINSLFIDDKTELNELQLLVNELNNNIMSALNNVGTRVSIRSPILERIYMVNPTQIDYIIPILLPLILLFEFLYIILVIYFIKNEAGDTELLFSRGFSMRKIKLLLIYKYVILPSFSELLAIIITGQILNKQEFLKGISIIIPWILFRLFSTIWIIIRELNNFDFYKISRPTFNGKKQSKKIFTIGIVILILGFIIHATSSNQFFALGVLLSPMHNFIFLFIILMFISLIMWLMENSELRGKIMNKEGSIITSISFRNLKMKKWFVLALLIFNGLFTSSLLKLNNDMVDIASSEIEGDYTVNLDKSSIDYFYNNINLNELFNNTIIKSYYTILSLNIVISDQNSEKLLRVNLINQTEFNKFECSGCERTDTTGVGYFNNYLWVSPFLFKKYIANSNENFLLITDWEKSINVSKNSVRIIDTRSGVNREDDDLFIHTSHSFWNKLGFNLHETLEKPPFSSDLFKYRLNLIITSDATKAQIENIFLSGSDLSSDSIGVRAINGRIEEINQKNQNAKFAYYLTLLGYFLTNIILVLMIFDKTSYFNNLSRVNERFGKTKNQYNTLILTSFFLFFCLLISNLFGVIFQYALIEQNLNIIFSNGIHLVSSINFSKLILSFTSVMILNFSFIAFLIIHHKRNGIV